MPTPLQRLKIYPILLELKACLCENLGDSSPCFCGILVGDDIPVDFGSECGEIGAAYVRLATAFPSTNVFPQPDGNALLDRPILRAYDLKLGIMRGVPYAGDEAPEQADVEAFAGVMLGDMQVLWETACCLSDKFEELDLQIAIGTYQPMAEQGGVVGAEWTIFLQDW